MKSSKNIILKYIFLDKSVNIFAEYLQIKLTYQNISVGFLINQIMSKNLLTGYIFFL